MAFWGNNNKKGIGGIDGEILPTTWGKGPSCEITGTGVNLLRAKALGCLFLDLQEHDEWDIERFDLEDMCVSMTWESLGLKRKSTASP